VLRFLPVHFNSQQAVMTFKQLLSCNLDLTAFKVYFCEYSLQGVSNHIAAYIHDEKCFSNKNTQPVASIAA
jgi:hypothetical protein